MLDLNQYNITSEVHRRIASAPDLRLREILTALVQHLHDFAPEVRLTEPEWMTGIEFLTRTGQLCSNTRQEFVLLSDTLGLSQRVVAQSHSRAEGVSEQTVFGPFHVEEAPKVVGLNSDIAKGAAGDPLLCRRAFYRPEPPLQGQPWMSGMQMQKANTTCRTRTGRLRNPV